GVILPSSVFAGVPAGHDLGGNSCEFPPELVQPAKRLTLGELESLSCALLPVLFAFLHTGIARQKTVLAQCRTQLRIESRNRAGEPHADRSSLTANAAAMRGHYDVNLVRQIRELHRLRRVVLPRKIRKILLNRPAVHRELARAGAHE